MKECPAKVAAESRWGKKPTEITRISVGPPENVVWDVVPGTSVRAPYSGYIQLTAHIKVDILPDGSMDRYMRKNKNFVQNPVDYRYEFDVSKNGLELIRSLSRQQCKTVGSGAAKG